MLHGRAYEQKEESMKEVDSGARFNMATVEGQLKNKRGQFKYMRVRGSNTI